MKLEPVLSSFREELFESPLPSTRRGSPSINLDMSDSSDDDGLWNCYDGRYNGTSRAETDEGRLSRSLQTWMIDHEWSTIQPLEKPPKEPIFTGKLGHDRKVYFRQERVQPQNKQNKKNLIPRAKTAPVLKRVSSNDSIHTCLSLLSCSSHESKKPPEERKLKKRRKRRVASRASASDDPHKSIWVEFALKKPKKLNSLFRGHAVLAVLDVGMIAGEYSGESEAFRMLDKDEQKSLLNCGLTKGIKYLNRNTLKRSSSLSDLKDTTFTPPKPIPRALSASAKKPFGKRMDINDLRKERLQRLKMEEQAKRQAEKERQKRKNKRQALLRRTSSKSVVESLTSRPVSASNTTTAQSVRSVQSPELRVVSPSEKSVFTDIQSEEKVTVWKGDREILEIDLKRELTERVKDKITSTRKALKRVTGVGDTNEQQQYVGRHDEFPKHVQDDYSHKPRIIQKMRISPHLSGVIHDDIQIRMGRPRYHEIREADLQQWNRGQPLNRAHRNLKVFNWLHSLKERDFREEIITEIKDEIDLTLADDLDLLHVEAADDPDVKPLYRAYEVRIL